MVLDLAKDHLLGIGTTDADEKFFSHLQKASVVKGLSSS